MKPRMPFLMGIPVVGFITLLTLMPVWGQSYSPARIVRLSFVEGDVTVQRPDVQAWAEAPVNTPLQQGFKVSTGENSFAEMQFENGGTVRLGERGLIDLTRLGTAPNGGKINQVDLHQGYATFHLLPSQIAESLQVATPYGALIAQGEAQFRVDLDQGLERIEVFSGAVGVQSNLGAMTIEKDSVLLMQPGATEPTVVSQGITKDDWDQWVDNREAEAEMPATGPSVNGYTDDATEATYGWNDLQQYGTWSDVPGEGYGWSPNVVAYGWAPYSAGQWCWYSGWGYTWIGSEPWGWLPYHYGGWDFIPGRGWVWFPGSLRRWSPSQVTWFRGPNWVGWTPRPYRKDGVSACGNNCGGGVVNTSTFRNGGVLTSNLKLKVNPATGTMVKEPGITPATAAMLPGPAGSLPAALSHRWRGNPAQPSAEAGIPATAMTSSGSRNAGATTHNSAIVYDPQQGSYINSGRRATKPVVQPTSPGSPPGASTLTLPAATPGLIQPVPAGSREQNLRPAENHGTIQPIPGGNYYVRPAPPSPNNNPSGGRVAGGGGQAAESHVGGGGASVGSHYSSAPAGGGHAGGAPAGGGGTGGGHH